MADIASVNQGLEHTHDRRAIEARRGVDVIDAAGFESAHGLKNLQAAKGRFNRLIGGHVVSPFAAARDLIA
jgi:hypothetical protein